MTVVHGYIRIDLNFSESFLSISFTDLVDFGSDSHFH